MVGFVSLTYVARCGQNKQPVRSDTLQREALMKLVQVGTCKCSNFQHWANRPHSVIHTPNHCVLQCTVHCMGTNWYSSWSYVHEVLAKIAVKFNKQSFNVCNNVMSWFYCCPYESRSFSKYTQCACHCSYSDTSCWLICQKWYAMQHTVLVHPVGTN